ncbi:hypothetical protein HXZ94_07375 [Empedobacter falsenii]|uniref:SMI1/KNR4 family protein n=1 Tax=Empedobacter falsenii TaxID=343874 RepID=UPI0025753308|nr:SMI1/KNR4 family protein [Empedobacter falsenii]MDM1298321.1 hypothetical protein [Empedobacter falsenii]MDM1318122.1 hypothetical protein [Empedobacter falsenii]
MNKKSNNLEKAINKALPNAYVNLLESFDNILLVELANGEEVDFHSAQSLLQLYDKLHKRYQMLTVLMEDYFVRKNNTQLYCRDTENEIDGITLTENLYFGKMGDDSALFFNLKDMSIWEFWQDDYSVGKISNSFEEFISDFTIIEKDDWNKFLNE